MGQKAPRSEEAPGWVALLLRRWLSAAPPAILERPPCPEDEELLRTQLMTLAGADVREGSVRAEEEHERGQPGVSTLVAAALSIWRALSALLEEGVDLQGEETQALPVIARELDASGVSGGLSPASTAGGTLHPQAGTRRAHGQQRRGRVIRSACSDASGGSGLTAAAALELIREVLAADGGIRQTPEMFARRLSRQPPARLGLPDRVELSGASLATFLESAHFPFGQYRAGEEALFVTPSLRLGASTLEALVRSGPGCRRVGGELLVWQAASFRVAAGAAADERTARPFVGPAGARAYLWLGPVLPGGPLVLRDANNAETRVAVPEEVVWRSGVQAGSVVRVPYSVSGKGGPTLDPAEYELRNTHHAPHPVLERAEAALRRGEDRATVAGPLRALMADPRAGGAALAGAGRLWQALGEPEVARAAFTMALERGSVEGALGLSRLAEAFGEGIEAAARPLDAAIARNLGSAALHARYAELLEGLGWEESALVEWHRRQAEELGVGMRDEG